MFEKIVPVNRERHAKTRVRDIQGFGFAAKFHIAYVTMHEFSRAAAVYPIVYVEDKDLRLHVRLAPYVCHRCLPVRLGL